MTIKRIRTCWFVEQGNMTRLIIGFGLFWRWQKSITDGGCKVWLFGPFTLVVL